MAEIHTQVDILRALSGRPDFALPRSSLVFVGIVKFALRGRIRVRKNDLPRLATLEERAAKLGPNQGNRRKRRPSDVEESCALKQGVDQWRQLWRDCGYTDEEVDQELEWVETLSRRCEESGFESWQIIKDMCDFVEAQALPLNEMKDALDDYPGPGFW